MAEIVFKKATPKSLDNDTNYYYIVYYHDAILQNAYIKMLKEEDAKIEKEAKDREKEQGMQYKGTYDKQRI